MEQKRTPSGASPPAFYVTLPGNPAVAMSGTFSSSAEAEPYLYWQRRGFPEAELTARIVLFERCE